MARYPATFVDANGADEIQVEREGRRFRMELRGVAFIGESLDDFVSEAGPAAAREHGFEMARDALAGYTLELELPVRVDIDGASRTDAAMHCRIEVGPPNREGAVEREVVTLILRCGGARYESPGTSGWFEDELLAIRRSLPEGTSMRTCFSCGLSDYSPYGHGLYGDLICFRAAKDVYRAVQDKAGLFTVLTKHGEPVPELDLCDEWELRPPGRGYRG